LREPHALIQLSRTIEEAKYLKYLDISYNKLLYKQAFYLLQAVSHSSGQLLFVNFGFNFLTQNSNFGNLQSPEMFEGELAQRGTY
jgi:hypothetical protein